MEIVEPDHIIECCSGKANETFLMIKLIGQIFVILIVGIILWRLSAMMNKKRINTDTRFFKRKF